MVNEFLQNWAKNITYTASKVHRPGTVEEVQELVAKSAKIRALGTRHCFNELANTPHELISLENLTAVEEIDVATKSVTLQAGLAYGKLSPQLESHGFGLPNLASLPHISVVGACATATHGSGVGNQNLAASLSSLQLVAPDGSLKTFSRMANAEEFEGIAVGLGAVGVVVRATLDLVPSFQVRQLVYEDLGYEVLFENFDLVMSGGYSVSLFLDWASPTVKQIWVKEKVDLGSSTSLPKDYFGAKASPVKRHPIFGVNPENCTDQLGIPGPWYERLPHFKMEFTPSSGEELQTEFFVSRSDAVAAIKAVRTLKEEIAPLLFVTEIRTIAEDRLWLSPQYKRDCVGIHFTWEQKTEDVLRLLPKIEAVLQPFEARPHWGKIFTMSKDTLFDLYPRFQDFRSLVRKLDQEKKFENPFLTSFVL